ncbi:MAG TPA: tetratricopeptide repeat protein [Acidiferrobacterales bacterium]|nr:tetratricopeptide repeat protein [Acidiferrobacterales bacterium]
MVAASLFFASSLAVSAAEPEIKLSRIVTAAAKDGQKFEEITGLYAERDGSIRLGDSGAGTLVTIGASAMESAIIASKQGLFGSRRLGGVARINADLLAVVKGGENMIAVVDNKGALRYLIGESGGDQGQLKDPGEIVYSPRDRLYVADRGNHRVSVFSGDGVFLFSFGAGPVPEGLDKPTHVAVDAQEQVYVLDSGGARVSVYAYNGRLLKQISVEKLNYAESPPKLSALAVDRQGQVFLADRANGKILQLDWQAAKPLRSFGSKGSGRGQFSHVTSMTISDDRKLMLGDSGNHKLEIYQLPETVGDSLTADELRLPSVQQGVAYKADCSAAYHLAEADLLCLNRSQKTVARVSASGKITPFAEKFTEPVAAAIDNRDIAIVDRDRLKIFSLDGGLRFSIGRGGSRDGEFDNPASVYLADKIYVADTGNSRVQMFSRDGIFLDKIANRKDRPETFRKPTAVVVDSQNNIYVADNGYNKVRVFSDKKELLFEIGAEEKSPQRFVRIHDLAIDKDDNLYVLASLAANKQLVQVYNGPKISFTFGSYAERNAGLTRATSLSLVSSEKTTLAAYDMERKRLQTFYYRQVPSRVGGLVVTGGLRHTQLRWQKAPGSFVSKYYVYAAKTDGDYQKILETGENTAAIPRAGERHYAAYRVSAVSGFNVEGVASQPRQDLFQVGYALYQDKKFSEATDVFARAYKEDAGHGEALEYLGRSLAEQSKTDDALRHFQDLAKIPGFEITGINLQAETLLQAKQFLVARALLNQTIAAKRTNADTYLLCGQIALQLGDAVGAVDCLENSLKLEGKNASAHFQLGQVYVKMGVVNKGLAEFDTAVNLAPQNVLIWQQSGEAYQALNKHKEALERFNKALALDSLNAGARLGAARSYIVLKEYDKARSIALSMSGDPAQEAAGQYLLGIIALANNNAQEAVLSLAKAGNKDPRNAAIWLALADAQANLKDDAKTKEALRQATVADANVFDGHFRLGMLEYEGKNFAAAADSLAKAVALQPGHYEARYTYARALFTLERYKETSDQAREAMKLEPKRTEPLALLADSARLQGKYGDAIEYLKKAVALTPASAQLHVKLGQIYLENNVYDSAQVHLEKAALLDAKNAVPHDLLGQMYLETRLFDAAIKAFSKAVALNPSPEIKLHLNTAYAEKKRSLEFKQNAPRLVLQDLRLDRVFSSAYKQYAHRPVGAVKVKNASGTEYKNLKLSFNIKGYMDFASSRQIPLLQANEIQEFPLLASFSNKILNIDEDTGVQVEVKLSFFQDGQESSTEITRPMTIYGKNAIQWANFNMIGSFVTPKDDVLNDFVRQTAARYTVSGGSLNKNLLTAMTLFDVLSAHGIKYLVDPNSPYSQINAEQVDTVQFPRETLKVKSGDCDDLSVLLSAGLENLGIETAMIDVPGHLFMMFNTTVAEKNKDAISLQDDLLIVRNHEVWIPLEATMIAASFSESWTEGARRYREAEKAKTLKVVELKQAWGQYVPVTLAPAGYTIDRPAAERVTPIIERERRILVTKNLDRLIMPYRAMLAHNPADQTAQSQIAIIYAQNGLHDLALKELDRLLEINPRSSEAHNNRGNIYYTLGDYDRALEAYAYAEQLDPTDGGIKLNLALTHYQRGRVKEAAERYREAVALSKGIGEQYKSFEKLLN